MDNSYNFDNALQYLNIGESEDLLYRNIENEMLTGRNVSINQKDLVSFASCSYLGLEQDMRLKFLSSNMTARYGTAFPTSRSYYKLGILSELEDELEKMFEKPCIHTTTTSLGHVAALPILIGRDDAIIYDHQVHTSVRNAFMICKGSGTYTEALRHNRIDMLESKIVRLKSKYKNVWFLGDGIYSMMGDAVDIKGLNKLMDKYSYFRVYLDDAHGIGWCGKNGNGYVLNNSDFHPQMVLAASLGKGFGSFGGVLVCPDERMKQNLIKLGSTLIFSTPNMPSVIGASIASARIHNSDEIYSLQSDLQNKVDYFKSEIDKYDLLRVDNSDSPIFFFGVGNPKIGMRSLKLIMEKGYYPSIAMYPAMPLNSSGIRVTITRTHTKREIAGFAKAAHESISQAMYEHKTNNEEVASNFVKLIGNRENVKKTQNEKVTT